MVWTYLAQDRKEWQALVITVNECGFHKMQLFLEQLCTYQFLIDFSPRIQFGGVMRQYPEKFKYVEYCHGVASVYYSCLLHFAAPELFGMRTNCEVQQCFHLSVSETNI